MLDLLISTVGQGLQWSVLALGVFLTFRILDIADLSVEGSFPLGAAAAATAITSGLGLPAAFVLARLPAHWPARSPVSSRRSCVFRRCSQAFLP